MNYIGSLWAQSGEAGLEDLEAILSAPPPALGAESSRTAPRATGEWVPALGGLGLGSTLGGVEATTVAATLLGAAAGGAVAGPWGVTAGAKSGALIVAAGASACGAAHHCYLHGWPSRLHGREKQGCVDTTFGK
ncbi:hypothetical protein WJX81_005436 [Elliptochloris bilobata]|uniref:Uncharacterized protein n=1 Tax=Elliptochloris bilobata TaxID=381761 RepID=A0AAW1RI69_9CHLO